MKASKKSQGYKITLVISKNLAHFSHHASQRIKMNEVKNLDKQGKIILKDDRVFIYMSGPEKFKGYHDVSVEFWGVTPEWYLNEIEYVDSLIKVARSK